MNKKNIQIVILAVFVLAIIPTICLFVVYLDPIKKTVNTFQGDEYIIAILLIRMLLLIFMSAYLYNQWLNQEKQFFSDIPFLFGTFFFLMFFGKAYDLFHDLTYYFIDDLSFLIILKIRFIIIVLNIAPMYYLSIKMILFFLSLSEKYAKFNNQLTGRIQLVSFLIILLIEIFIILLFLNVETSLLILPGIVIPSFLIIVFIFYFAYKNQRLSQVNPLILTISFAAYLASQISRPILQSVLGESPIYIFFSELTDLVIFSIFFLGLINKIRYK